MRLDRYLVVRAASVYIAMVLAAVVCVVRRPSNRAMVGAVLASVWNLVAVLLLHVVATRVGWWRFDAHGGLVLGLPVDVYLAWAWLWGAVPALAFPAVPLGLVVAIAIAFDVIVMPAAVPVLRLGPWWLAGEAIGLAVGLVPGQLLARWTAQDRHVNGRALLQVVAFAGLMLFVLPALVIEGSQSAWANPFLRPAWQLSLIAQALAVPALVGLSAVQEFATRGGGTPVPFDPPKRLVTTGVYAYVANPMQLSAVVLLALIGIVVGNAWVAAAGLMAHVYSSGFAAWDEDDDLAHRFGQEWNAYRAGVRRWRPRVRPWHPSDGQPARLFVSATCDMCSEVGRWFERRGAVGLAIVPAEQHPSGALERITYEPADGSRAASGIEAVARALEHVHLGWAIAGFALRLPGVAGLAQLLADASGAEPRGIPSMPSCVPAARDHRSR